MSSYYIYVVNRFRQVTSPTEGGSTVAVSLDAYDTIEGKQDDDDDEVYDVIDDVYYDQYDTTEPAQNDESNFTDTGHVYMHMVDTYKNEYNDVNNRVPENSKNVIINHEIKLVDESIQSDYMVLVEDDDYLKNELVKTSTMEEQVGESKLADEQSNPENNCYPYLAEIPNESEEIGADIVKEQQTNKSNDVNSQKRRDTVTSDFTIHTLEETISIDIKYSACDC